MLYYIFFIVLFFYTDSTHCSNTPQGVIFVDLDDTISRNDSISLKETLHLVKKAAPCCNSAYDAGRLFCNIKSITSKSHELARKPNATTETVILDIIEYMKQKKYGDFKPIMEPIGRLAANKKPIYPMIKLLQMYKNKGYILIAITNQDAWGHIHYRKKLLKNYHVDLNNLFNATLCCHSTIIAHENPPLSSIKNCYLINEPHTIYMTTRKEIKKPSSDYFIVALDIAKKHFPEITQNTKLLFFDDAQINIDGFNTFITTQKLMGKAILVTQLKDRKCAYHKSDERFVQHIIKPQIESFLYEKGDLHQAAFA